MKELEVKRVRLVSAGAAAKKRKKKEKKRSTRQNKCEINNRSKTIVIKAERWSAEHENDWVG